MSKKLNWAKAAQAKTLHQALSSGGLQRVAPQVRVKPSKKLQAKRRVAQLRRKQGIARHDALHTAEAESYAAAAPGLRKAVELVKPSPKPIPPLMPERPQFAIKADARRYAGPKRGPATLGEVLKAK